MGELEFAVVDVETTGFSPKLNDRVIEIGIVRITAAGELLDEYETLVNPQRDVGPTQVHGIKARQVSSAPTFGEVAGDVARRLEQAVFVAHNVMFDSAFIVSEYARLGYNVSADPALCTMRLASRVGLPGRRLDACCRACGIPLDSHHSALCDARAAGVLLLNLLRLGGLTPDDALMDLNASTPRALPHWPSLPTCGRTLTRRTSDEQLEAVSTYTAELVQRLSALGLGGAPDLAPYLELLDRVLEDEVVTREEVESLHDLAVTLGMTGAQIAAAHDAYLRALAGVAWSDGILTDEEVAELVHVGALLGFDRQAALAIVGGCENSAAPVSLPTARLVGLSVCFTGELTRLTREQAQELAQRAGLQVKDGVTKKLDILVCADPHSQSGKARKAREYGTRIMSEETFWRLIGQ